MEAFATRARRYRDPERDDAGLAAAARPAPPPPAVAAATPRWPPDCSVLALAVPAIWLLLGPTRGRPQRLAAEAENRVLAVLPFKNLGDPGDQYFADGLTEELTSRLAGLGGLRVISRTSAEQYRDSPEIAEGNRRRAAGRLRAGGKRALGPGQGGPGRVRVTPRLISVADDSPLWSEEYEVELTEVFRVQSEIAQQVTAALDLALRDAGAGLARRGRHRDAGGLRLLPPRQRVRRAELQPRQHRGGGGSLSQGGVARLDFRAGLGPARAGPLGDVLVLLRPVTGAARLGSHGAWRPRCGSRRPPEGAHRAGVLLLLGTVDYPRALEEFEAARRQQPSNSECWRPSATSSAARGSGTAHWPGSRRRCATTPAPHSGRSTWPTPTCRSASTPRPSADSIAPSSLRRTGPSRTPTRRCSIWSGGATANGARSVIGQALTRVSGGRMAQALLIPDAISASLLTADSVFAAAVDAVRAVRLRRRHRPVPPASGGGVGVSGRPGRSARHRRLGARACWSGRCGPARRRQAAGVGRPRLRPARGGRPEAMRAGRRAAELLPPGQDANSGPFVLTRLAQIYTLVNEPDQALGRPGALSPNSELDQPRRAAQRPDLGPAAGGILGFARLAGSA